MMRGIRTWAVAVRAPTKEQLERANREIPAGEIAVQTFPFTSALRRHRVLRLPVLRARLYDRALAEQRAAVAADRRSQVGTGERAEKIRTYNFPQRRVTDHRVHLADHNLDAVLDGALDDFSAALAADEKRRRLAEQAGE